MTGQARLPFTEWLEARDKVVNVLLQGAGAGFMAIAKTQAEDLIAAGYIDVEAIIGPIENQPTESGHPSEANEYAPAENIWYLDGAEPVRLVSKSDFHVWVERFEGSLSRGVTRFDIDRVSKERS